MGLLLDLLVDQHTIQKSSDPRQKAMMMKMLLFVTSCFLLADVGATTTYKQPETTTALYSKEPDYVSSEEKDKTWEPDCSSLMEREEDEAKELEWEVMKGIETTPVTRPRREAKAKAKSRSVRAGLQFPVGRIHRML